MQFMFKNERVWVVIRLQARGEYLGTVKAVDEKAAREAAIRRFGFTVEGGKNLFVRPV
jgi:hypothetical protein